jgi:hypothetical protein
MSLFSIFYEDHYTRVYPYRHINDPTKPVHETFSNIAEGLRTGKLSGKEVADFLGSHSFLFMNTETNMPSSQWHEQPDSNNRAYFHCRISCSCECGPLSEPCNEQGPSSKI